MWASSVGKGGMGGVEWKMGKDLGKGVEGVEGRGVWVKEKGVGRVAGIILLQPSKVVSLQVDPLQCRQRI